MYELFILCMLMRWPMHGYLIAKIINDTIGPYARLSNGRLYPLLAKLQEDGLIVTDDEAEGKGARQSHRYRITDEGKMRWYKLMMDTTSNPGDYSKLFQQKSCHMEHLKLTERLYLVDHYTNYCQAHVLHLTAEAEDLRNNPAVHDHLDSLVPTLGMMEHMIEQWQLELAWAHRLRERELANAEGQLSEPPAAVRT